MIKAIKKCISEQNFNPGFMGIFTNPLYIIRKRLFQSIVSNKMYLKGKMLDFGCGKRPYEKYISVEEYIGLDIESSGHNHEEEKIDVYYNGRNIPFNDNSFDSVFSTEVFEHVFNLNVVTSEIYRVLKPSGHLLISIPFVWDEHEAPYDFARYTSFGIKSILEEMF